MYYYYDSMDVLQGPFSESAFSKWFANNDIPAQTMLYDCFNQRFLIEEVLNKSLKAKAKVIFCNDTFNMDGTLDRTELDVTLDPNSFTCSEFSVSSDDFTQIEEGVDEVDCGKGSENDQQFTHLQKMVNIYLDRRSRNNQRRRIQDTYVPFEFPWSRWVPHPMNLSDVIRGTCHLQNTLQNFDEDIFSSYLGSLNIYPRPCYLCNVPFVNSHQMLMHFLSVVHVRRTYDLNLYFSVIDVNCVLKMMSEVESSMVNGTNWTVDDINAPAKKCSFFDEADITTAFDSMKSTVSLLQNVPLLMLPAREAAADTCEYVELVLFLRDFENFYYKTSRNLRSRRYGGTAKTRCAYCDVEFDGTFLDSFPKHLLSEKHIQNTLLIGVSRPQMEYWLSFLNTLLQPNRNHSRHKETPVSLQEGDFPLCYRFDRLPQEDFVYKGSDVNQVLNYVREIIRTQFQILDDYACRTCCRWCGVELHSHNSILHHILYDKRHRGRLPVISNDDIRRLLRHLKLSVSLPLFRESFVKYEGKTPQMSDNEKEISIQRLRNVCYRVYKQRTLRQIAFRSFPFGLVNKCKLCNVSIEQIDRILTHFGSEQHYQSLMRSSRMSYSDVACWLKMFDVRNPLP